jgi:hypothetical protein
MVIAALMSYTMFGRRKLIRGEIALDGHRTDY